MMSSDDYQVQDIYSYSRKSYRKNTSEAQEHTRDYATADATVTTDGNEETNGCCPGCAHHLDTDSDIADIFHKKCPVIALAQQQLQRTVYEVTYVLLDALLKNKCKLALVMISVIFFFVGLVLGAASCGSYNGQFNSPILTCIDNYFISDKHTKLQESLRCIV